MWTLANDLIDFGKDLKKTGNTVETIAVEPADCPAKVRTALPVGEKEPDIIVGKPQMLEDFYNTGFFEGLHQFGEQDYANQVVNCVWEAGQEVFS